MGVYIPASARKRAFLFLAAIAIAVGCCLNFFSHALLASDEDLTLKDIAEANAKAIAAIHSAVIEMRDDMEYAGESPAKLSPASISTWTIQNDEVKTQERHWFFLEDRNIFGVKAETIRESYSEYYSGPDKFIELLGYDPQKPPASSEYDARGIHVLTGPRQSQPWVGKDLKAYLFMIGYYNDDWSLSALIDKDECKITKTPSQTSNKCYELEIIHKDPNLRFVVSVDPTRNCLIQKVECYKDDTLSYTSEVLSYVNANEVCVPKEMQSAIYNPASDPSKKPTVVTAHRRVNVKSLNEVIPKEALEIKIPEWARVQEVNGGKYYIWGKGKPYLTFDSADAYSQWEQELWRSRLLWWWGTAAICLFIVAVLLLFLYLTRRAAARRRTAESESR